MKKKYALGFTLAELLAVVIIVALLSALSLGAYRKSVEQSRFSEGLAAASAVVEAINRARFDDKIEGRTVSGRHSYATLDISLPNPCGSTSNYCRATNHFEVKIELEGTNQEVVRAYRNISKDDYQYYIEIFPDYGSDRDKLSCVDNSSGGGAQAFCESMGYVHCNNKKCTK